MGVRNHLILCCEPVQPEEKNKTEEEKKTKNKETCASRSRPRPFTRPLSSVPGPVPFRPAEAEALFAGLELKVFDHLSAKGGLTARQASGNRFFGPRGWAGLAGLVAAPLFRRVSFFGEGAEPFSFGFSFSTPHPGVFIFLLNATFAGGPLKRTRSWIVQLGHSIPPDTWNSSKPPLFEGTWMFNQPQVGRL